jgi:hypothetical protein
VPDPTPGIPAAIGDDRHRIADGRKVTSKPILGGLHHEYAIASA